MVAQGNIASSKVERSVWGALVTPHAQPAARAPNETLSGNHHILSSRAREHCTPSKISRLLHGKLEGGELQVNSIVPLLTFGLFARTWVCRSLTYSTLLLHSLCLHSYESYIHSYVKVMLGLSAWSAIWHVFAELRMEWNFMHFQFFNKFKDLDNLLKSRCFQLIWMNINQQGWLSKEDNYH